ncbi:MAG: 2-aminoethylphosphonate--pyruvate transaminase [Marinilabiliaceae bacterium]|jgi:2-aminoethylphosphonate-pyruvate transaminase|nr:2-aminoethylphosphonate--pyruvate transaminase [Marinilabiliaceae bacterium]
MEKLLFTPGPVSTLQSVKSQMFKDFCSDEHEVINVIENVHYNLLNIVGQKGDSDYDVILLQGPGPYAIESAISSLIPHESRILLIVNGTNAERLIQITKIHDIEIMVLRFAINTAPNLQIISGILVENPEITHIALVHSEPDTGIVNPVDEIGQLSKVFRKTFLLDAIYSFGGIPLDIKESNIDILISTSGICLEGVPGLSFVIAKQSILNQQPQKPKTLSLDLISQYREQKERGLFRFTPPVQLLMAFSEALSELKREGGVTVRTRRYYQNNRILVKGMKNLGFEPLTSEQNSGYFISVFRVPSKSFFNLEEFISEMYCRGFVLERPASGGNSLLRIASIGQIYPEDIQEFLNEVEDIVNRVTMFNIDLSLRSEDNNLSKGLRLIHRRKRKSGIKEY